jgi:hypothetical protein
MGTYLLKSVAGSTGSHDIASRRHLHLRSRATAAWSAFTCPDSRHSSLSMPSAAGSGGAITAENSWVFTSRPPHNLACRAAGAHCHRTSSLLLNPVRTEPLSAIAIDNIDGRTWIMAPRTRRRWSLPGRQWTQRWTPVTNNPRSPHDLWLTSMPCHLHDQRNWGERIEWARVWSRSPGFVSCTVYGSRPLLSTLRWVQAWLGTISCGMWAAGPGGCATPLKRDRPNAAQLHVLSYFSSQSVREMI